MALPIAAVAAPLITRGIAGLFGRKKAAAPDPAVGYRNSLSASADAAAREAADYRQRDMGQLDALKQRLVGYQSRITNPATYRAQDNLAYGQGAADAAYGAEQARSRIAAAMPGYDSGAVAGAVGGVESQHQGALAALRARLLTRSLDRQDAAEREALDLERQFEGDMYGRAQDAQERRLATLRYLLGDTTDTARYNASQASARADRNAGLLGSLGQAAALYLGARR